MNKFKKLTNKLLNIPLWSSTLTYIPRITNKVGPNNSFLEGESKTFSAVVTSVNKNIVDNTNILLTDLTLIVDSLTIEAPSKNDLIIYNDKTYNIVQIKPLGILNNDPVGFQIIMRLA